MIVGTGVDLAEIDRMARALGSTHGGRFIARVFTEGERRYCESRGRGRLESYTARFAAKEATMKALGVGWGANAGWRDIEVVRERGQAPCIVLSGSARRTAARRGIDRVWVALSHSGNLAIAFVVAERD